MTLDEVKRHIEKHLPGVALKPVRESLLVENPLDLPRVVAFLKADGVLQLNYLSSVTGVDYLHFLECVYHLYSMENKTYSLQLRVRVDREDPHVPSLVPIFRGAELQEREAYDMYGFQFDGHPDLRRILMWDGFAGHPMRKDYKQEDSEVLDSDDIEWLQKHDVKVSEEHIKMAESLQTGGESEQPESEQTEG